MLIDKIAKLTKFQTETDDQKRSRLRKEFLRHEARIGGKLFGPVKKDGDRQFFCLDEYTWIWYEKWTENDEVKTRTTRYEVRPDGILKAQDDKHFRMISENEADKFLSAVIAYEKKVNSEIYNPILQRA